jgi:hypothetical protein
MSRVLAFDIGIKNLAWCCGDVTRSDQTATTAGTSTSVVVRGWSNENLITGATADEDIAANQCCVCKKGSTNMSSTGQFYCVRHCPLPALRDPKTNALIKKKPAVTFLKTLAATFKAEKTDMKTRDSLETFLQKHLCFPKVAAVAVKKVDLESIHNGLRAVVLANRELFASCDSILLENQPAFKNPVMKSVQMMLFATLRDLLIDFSAEKQKPSLHLVHAGRKTAGVTKGDEGYTERKNASETRVLTGITEGHITFASPTQGQARDVTWFRNQKKKSDLADCLCMVIDSVK